jgi:pimeloyl-ACP methyl ester carboxylesterase
MTPTIYYIHGFNSSHRSFTYLESLIASEPVKKIDYDSRKSLEEIVAQVLKQLPKDKPITLVGHSLGGVVALLLAGRKSVQAERVITISSPLGGSKAAVFARWVVSGFPILSDITPSSPAMRELMALKDAPPVLSIISVGGSLPTSMDPNDSVVSVASQKAFAPAKKVEINANHFEILMHEKTLEHINKFIGA